jgi:hypothetical protein
MEWVVQQDFGWSETYTECTERLVCQPMHAIAHSERLDGVSGYIQRSNACSAEQQRCALCEEGLPSTRQTAQDEFQTTPQSARAARPSRRSTKIARRLHNLVKGLFTKFPRPATRATPYQIHNYSSWRRKDCHYASPIQYNQRFE